MFLHIFYLKLPLRCIWWGKKWMNMPSNARVCRQLGFRIYVHMWARNDMSMSSYFTEHLLEMQTTINERMSANYTYHECANAAYIGVHSHTPLLMPKYMCLHFRTDLPKLWHFWHKFLVMLNFTETAPKRYNNERSIGFENFVINLNDSASCSRCRLFSVNFVMKKIELKKALTFCENIWRTQSNSWL